MAASVQGWRTKWFYIKDRKISSSDEYGIAPFDASQELKKLASWDSPPTEAEMEEIKPLLARIQELKGGRGGALSGTQLMAFFLQRRIQPLQHRLSKLWTFSGLEDPSRVSKDLIEKKDLDKRVRALTILTKDHEVADLAASYFDSEHPLPVERTSSTTSPPPALSEDFGVDKKRKCVEEFASSSASAHKTVAGETFAPEDNVELFDLIDS
jgi:hypothetical protein